MTSGRDKMAASNKKHHRDEVYIALLGVTGAGKTTFCQHASGDMTLQVGHSIYSCTQEPKVIRFKLPDGLPIALIDTPGFDDDSRSDVEILEQLVSWMAEQKDVIRRRLSGIILLQPITVQRVGGTERKRTRLLKNILGEDAYKHVIIATTMWEQLKDEVDTDERMRGRREDLWGDMVRKGTRIVKHANNKESAHRIIRMVIESGKVKPLLEMELARNPRVVKTTAGKDVRRQLEKQIRQARSSLREHAREQPPRPRDPREDNSEENSRARIVWTEWSEEKQALQEDLRVLEGRLKKLNSLSFKFKHFLAGIFGV